MVTHRRLIYLDRNLSDILFNVHPNGQRCTINTHLINFKDSEVEVGGKEGPRGVGGVSIDDDDAKPKVYFVHLKEFVCRLTEPKNKLETHQLIF